MRRNTFLPFEVSYGPSLTGYDLQCNAHKPQGFVVKDTHGIRPEVKCLSHMLLCLGKRIQLQCASKLVYARMWESRKRMLARHNA